MNWLDVSNINSRSKISWIRNTGLVREQSDSVYTSQCHVQCLMTSSFWEKRCQNLVKYHSQREIIRDCQSSWHGPVRWEAGVDQSAFEHNKHAVFAFFVSCNQLLQHEYYVFSTSCNKTAYHWCYIIHRITTKPVGLKWFDTLTFTCGVDHRVTARKWTSADLMLGQRRGQVRWEGDIDQSALEHACQSNLSVSCTYWQWFMTDHIGIKIYLCNTIKSNIIT